jgi:hypothetical protein
MCIVLLFSQYAQANPTNNYTILLKLNEFNEYWLEVVLLAVFGSMSGLLALDIVSKVLGSND